MTSSTNSYRSQFGYVDTQPDPHRVRRRAILEAHPEVRALIGFNRLSLVLLLTVAVLQVAIAYGVKQAVRSEHWVASWFVLIPFTMVVGGILNHWISMGIHESSHRLMAKTDLANRLAAICANAAQVVPGAMTFWRHHMKHHTHLGIEGEDNDLATSSEIRWVGRSPVRKLLWLIAYPIYSIKGRGFAVRPDRWEWINIAIVLPIDVLLVYLVGPEGMLYLLASGYFGHCLLHPTAAHFIHEHYVWRRGQETYSYYGILNWVNFHVGYHVEHHDIMSIPCWNLPKLHRIAQEHYQGLTSSKSWVHLLFSFVVRKDVGHESRVVRESVEGTPSALQRMQHAYPDLVQVASPMRCNDAMLIARTNMLAEVQ